MPCVWKIFVYVIIATCGCQATEEGGPCTHDDGTGNVISGTCRSVARCDSAKQTLNNKGKISICGGGNGIVIVCCFDALHPNASSTKSTTVSNRKPNYICLAPLYPEHGSYTVTNNPHIMPGLISEHLHLNVVCNEGYKLSGDSSVFCVTGVWSTPMPQCVQQSKYSPGMKESPLQNTTFESAAECGEESQHPLKVRLVYNTVTEGRMPWHASIYRNAFNAHEYVCGGTLVTNTKVISAAQCFYKHGIVLSPDDFVVAFGKMFQNWNNANDYHAQTRNIIDIKIPNNFGDKTNYFENDVAVITLGMSVEYTKNVRPACISFDAAFHDNQLQQGSIGKMVTWRMEDAPLQVQNVIEMPYIDRDLCLSEIQEELKSSLASDKICAGYANSTLSNDIYSGTGLVFAHRTTLSTRYYIRGVSVQLFPRPIFTSIQKHKDFLSRYLN